jgi:hypothetical protein
MTLCHIKQQMLPCAFTLVQILHSEVNKYPFLLYLTQFCTQVIIVMSKLLKLLTPQLAKNKH